MQLSFISLPQIYVKSRTEHNSELSNREKFGNSIAFNWRKLVFGG